MEDTKTCPHCGSAHLTFNKLRPNGAGGFSQHRICCKCFGYWVATYDAAKRFVEIRRWQYLSKQDEREIENLKYAREVFKEFRRSQK